MKNSIFILTDWYSPGFRAGGPIQSCVNLVNALKDSYEVSVLTSDKDFSEKKSYAEIESDIWMSNNGVKIYYASNRKLKSLFPLRFLKGDIDILYLNSMFSVRFTLLPLLYLKLGLISFKKVILAPRGMLGSGAIEIKKTKKRIFLFFANIFDLYKNVIFHATREQEKLDILVHFPKSEINVIPNISAINVINKGIKKNPKDLKLISVARVSLGKKTLYLLELMSQLPDNFSVTLDIYGSINDFDYFEKCKKKVRNIQKNIIINFCLPVPHNELMMLLKQYHFFILPTPGENFGHAIAESLSSGLPVIISDQTPWHNLIEANAGWEISLQSQEEFLKILEKAYWMGNIEYQEMRQCAFKYFMVRSNTEELINSYNKFF